VWPLGDYAEGLQAQKKIFNLLTTRVAMRVEDGLPQLETAIFGLQGLVLLVYQQQPVATSRKQNDSPLPMHNPCGIGRATPQRFPVKSTCVWTVSSACSGVICAGGLTVISPFRSMTMSVVCRWSAVQ
jgi:hypothetical protein